MHLKARSSSVKKGNQAFTFNRVKGKKQDFYPPLVIQNKTVDNGFFPEQSMQPRSRHLNFSENSEVGVGDSHKIDARGCPSPRVGVQIGDFGLSEGVQDEKLILNFTPSV